MPDIFNGDPIGEMDLNNASFNREAWFARHPEETWKTAVDPVVAALKEQGVTRFGTTGYCFGAPPAWYLACKNESHVTVVSHPSRLKIPDDLEVSLVCDASQVRTTLTPLDRNTRRSLRLPSSLTAARWTGRSH